MASDVKYQTFGAGTVPDGGPAAGILAPPAAGAQQGYISPQQPQIQASGMQPVVAPSGAPAPLGQIQWMPHPQAVPGCPPGLEYLTQVDQLLVHQQVELFEVVTDIETQNRYQVKNSLGQQIYFAHEESEFCERICCGPRRGFTMHVTDNMNQEVLRISRELKICGGCCWCANADCCAMDIAVEAPVGNVIGYVRQAQSWWYPNFDLLNVAKEPVLKILGPFWFCQNVCCTGDIDFNVMNEDSNIEVGKLSKQWGGFVKEAFTKADNFNVNFPLDLSVDMKACLLGAVFLIDFMYFERKKDTNERHH
ncbi:phospholipid scramblase 2-like [Acanthaster planci]|uniref:Phospholipid scramblase n=1 Tax=Acanthaster planci TaxID=133434 RepID=A0A8B7YUH4_ACAPL|nr:phospholipid scramblase 2-like [Acanthaster planci]